MRPGPRGIPAFAARLAVLVTALLAVLAPLVVPGPAAAAPLDKTDLLTLAEAETVYPQLRGRHDDGQRDVSRFGIDRARLHDLSAALRPLPELPRHQPRARLLLLAERAVVRPRPRGIVQLRTRAEARAVLAHFRAFIEACRGTHATTDGEGGKATMKVRGWQPRRVGDERVGLLDAFIQYGDTTWRRTLVTRLGRTVLLLEVEPRRGTGSAARVADAADLALAKLG